MKVAAGKTRVGWIGTGIMGAPMAGHVLRAGYSLLVYNRTRAKAEGLLAAGARWADSPRAVAAESDVVFTLVGFPRDVEEVHLGEVGVIQSIRPGSIVVDMTTSPPVLARRLAEQYAARGVAALDAPVTGGDAGARAGKLVIMVGGERRAFRSVRCILKVMGRHVGWMGPPGAGQQTKMVNQILIAGTMIGLCESLLYASGAGLDAQAVIKLLGKGSGGGPLFNRLGPRILDHDFAPGFIVEHFIKDMSIALQEAQGMRLSLPGLALVERLYQQLRAAGHGRDGTQALVLVLEQMAGGT